MKILVEKNQELLLLIGIQGNYPNPFNTLTTIEFDLYSWGFADLIIYNIMGQKVATLVDGQQDAGYHNVIWNSTNLASGVYLYQLQAESHTLTKKLVLLK